MYYNRKLSTPKFGFLGKKMNLPLKEILKKRIELITWVLQNMKNPNVEICSLIESRMNETIQEIKKKDSIFESDILDSELRILDWFFYQVCKDQQKNWEKSLLGYQK